VLYPAEIVCWNNTSVPLSSLPLLVSVNQEEEGLCLSTPTSLHLSNLNAIPQVPLASPDFVWTNNNILWLFQSYPFWYTHAD